MQICQEERFLKFCKVATHDGIRARVFFSGLLFAGVFPVRNLAEFQKTRAEGPLGKCQIQRAFSEILQSCDQGKLLQKVGPQKHPGANAIMS